MHEILQTNFYENMIDDESLLVNFNVYYNIPRVLLVLSHSDATSLYLMSERREFKKRYR